MRVSLIAVITYSSHTAKISHASFTCSQSASESVNADHIICFETWPLDRIVVMGPYQWSALATNKVMGYYLFR